MISTTILNRVHKNDEWYTQAYAVIPIIKYLKQGATILCPFDDKNSQYVKVFTDHGFNVIYRHIDNGEDFFDLTVEWVKENNIDYIISNPPFSIRKQVIIKLFELKVPFGLLIPLVSIALKPIRERIENCELLLFDKRIKFISGDGMICKNPPSETAYICSQILPKQIIFCQLNEKGV